MLRHNKYGSRISIKWVFKGRLRGVADSLQSIEFSLLPERLRAVLLTENETPTNFIVKYALRDVLSILQELVLLFPLFTTERPGLFCSDYRERHKLDNDKRNDWREYETIVLGDNEIVFIQR